VVADSPWLVRRDSLRRLIVPSGVYHRSWGRGRQTLETAAPRLSSMNDLIQIEFVGGPMDGAIRPIPHGCIEVPLAAGAVMHIYRRDEIYVGSAVKQIMRHSEAKATWRDKDEWYGHRPDGNEGMRA
jgi:hypothetical protein